MSVIIVGGGMVGATLALAISQLSHGTLPVHLIEASEPETDRHPGFDARAIALAAGTCQQLARIGVWQAIADCATAIKTVHVSDRGHAGFVTLDAQEYRIPALGGGRTARRRAASVCAAAQSTGRHIALPRPRSQRVAHAGAR